VWLSQLHKVTILSFSPHFPHIFPKVPHFSPWFFRHHGPGVAEGPLDRCLAAAPEGVHGRGQLRHAAGRLAAWGGGGAADDHGAEKRHG
jgi:hypothetical protein